MQFLYLFQQVFVEWRCSAVEAINEMKSFEDDSNPDRYHPPDTHPKIKKERKVLECKADEVNSVLIGQLFIRLEFRRNKIVAE